MKRTLLPLLCGAIVALGMTVPVSAAEVRPAATNAAPVSAAAAAKAALAAVPKSEFILPRSAQEGRNPFFPQARPAVAAPVEKNAPVDVGNFVLNGITGPPLRSAMINGRTFLKGEEGEIRLQSGSKILIKCEDIKDESAIIIVGGARRELRLRFGI